jgi:hypothetical protein
MVAIHSTKVVSPSNQYSDPNLARIVHHANVGNMHSDEVTDNERQHALPLPPEILRSGFVLPTKIIPGKTNDHY